MSRQVTHARGLVQVAYHQFLITDEDGPAAAGEIAVLTGVSNGDVEATVTLHEAVPVPGDKDWQEIVEVSAHSASGELMVRAMMDDSDEELPVLSFNGPGDYRLRIHASGCDTAVDLTPEEVTEWYCIQAWPDSPRDVAVLRQRDA